MTNAIYNDNGIYSYAYGHYEVQDVPLRKVTLKSQNEKNCSKIQVVKNPSKK